MRPPAADSIAEVLEALDDVVARARAEASPAGYFAAVYRTVTATVAHGIDEGYFDDAARMERLDVAFATRYLDAVDAVAGGREPTRSWQVAFAAASRWRPVVLQHLLAGINAHINLDLGIAAAEVAPGEELAGLRGDFDRINEILALVQRGVVARLGEVSPGMRWFDVVGARRNAMLARFSIEVARSAAWRFATELAALPVDERAAPIAARDRRIAEIGEALLDPGWLAGAVLLAVRLRERGGVAHRIDVLGDVPRPDLGEVEARVQQRGDGD